ncbi:unnamed protein product [Pleuronectes platessa]|uniref:Uncharacterized protein n=1 Tax=Pleuronectes platessa TaxID=8262 RepID=A0A9N7Z0I5_PLEPL|nr:unnamed protein product [Pleuronectes platessa]
MDSNPPPTQTPVLHCLSDTAWSNGIPSPSLNEEEHRVGGRRSYDELLKHYEETERIEQDSSSGSGIEINPIKGTHEQAPRANPRAPPPPEGGFITISSSTK